MKSKKNKNCIKYLNAILLTWATLSMVMLSNYDYKLNEINTELISYELERIFDRASFLIGGIFYQLNSSIRSIYTNKTLEVGQPFESKPATYPEAISYILNKEIVFKNDLIVQNAFLKQRDYIANKRTFWFWNAFGSLIILVLLQIFGIKITNDL